MYMPERAPRPLPEMIELRGCRTARCRSTALIAPAVMMTSTTVSARRPGEQAVGDRHDREEQELLAVDRSWSRGSTENSDGDERRAGVRGQRPEHGGHFEPLAAADDDGEPQHASDREQQLRTRKSKTAGSATKASSA